MWLPLRPATPKVVLEDSDALGYRLCEEPLLAVMGVAEWRAIERAALAAGGTST